MKPAYRREAVSYTHLDVYKRQHLYSFVASLGRVLRRPWTTLLTIGVMAVALALPLGLGLALDNLRHFAGNVEQSREIDLFLKPDVAALRAQAIASELGGRADVAKVELRTPEQGLAEFRARSGLGEALDALEENPLPFLLVITPKEKSPTLVAMLERLPETGLLQHCLLYTSRCV